MPGPIHTDSPVFAGLASREGGRLEADGRSEGTYRGERVALLDDAPSPLQIAGEEPALQHEGHDEKPLGRRTLRDASKKGEAPDPGRVQRVLDKLGDLHKSLLERTLMILLRLRHAQSLELRLAVRDQLPEPSHQYAALLSLVERLREEGASAERIAAAEQAVRELEQEQGPAIRAALNVSEVAADFAEARLAELQTLRETYRSVVLDAPDLSQTLKALIERYGEPELARAIQFLLRALSADLAADGTSTDPAKLNSVLNDLYRLELLTGLLEDCEDLVGRYRAFGQGFKATDLLAELLALQGQTWLRPELIAPLPGKLGVREIETEIGFLRELKNLVRLIPLKAYADGDQRQRLLDVVQQALDGAIEREENGEG
ncbi:type III secretion system gatekeeper subunit SctW [Imhoffiella purpurea]|uniref:Type III secretion outermembrane contact sensing protein (YopN,Yop4b,LcrE) n=1 Tax=Imhoffiella purpurea TaxID=1249627 RepID=W9VZ17_9GAMM|nr:type III secretion system gatekeeper subunit SctW [Imhoffiella purpurea]EXJ15645.1 Type III secretion outermembrane contact sensing protein (YopN,Yop4b,LcrE) [Imhoffiella purpurea]